MEYSQCIILYISFYLKPQPWWVFLRHWKLTTVPFNFRKRDSSFRIFLKMGLCMWSGFVCLAKGRACVSSEMRVFQIRKLRSLIIWIISICSEQASYFYLAMFHEKHQAPTDCLVHNLLLGSVLKIAIHCQNFSTLWLVCYSSNTTFDWYRTSVAPGQSQIRNFR